MMHGTYGTSVYCMEHLVHVLVLYSPPGCNESYISILRYLAIHLIYNDAGTSNFCKGVVLKYVVIERQT